MQVSVIVLELRVLWVFCQVKVLVALPKWISIFRYLYELRIWRNLLADPCTKILTILIGFLNHSFSLIGCFGAQQINWSLETNYRKELMFIVNLLKLTSSLIWYWRMLMIYVTKGIISFRYGAIYLNSQIIFFISISINSGVLIYTLLFCTIYYWTSVAHRLHWIKGLYLCCLQILYGFQMWINIYLFILFWSFFLFLFIFIWILAFNFLLYCFNLTDGSVI